MDDVERCTCADEGPPVIAVTGYRDSGKTTAIEAIVKACSLRGTRVGVFKHCCHGYDLDQPGKDSWRIHQAGAAGTVVMGPKGFAFLGGSCPDQDPRRLASWLFPNVDLILAEGFHWIGLPRIEIGDRDGRTRPGHPEGEVLGRLPFKFGSREIRAVCDLLEARYVEGRREREVARRAILSSAQTSSDIRRGDIFGRRTTPHAITPISQNAAPM